MLLPAPRFTAYLCERVAGGEGSKPELLLGMHTDDLYICCACLDRVPGAIDAFQRAHEATMRHALGRFDLSDADKDDILQTLRVNLFVQGKLAGYSGRGPLAGWIRSAATRLGLDLLDARKPRHDDSDDILANLTSTGNAELDLIRGRFREEFKKAFGEAIAALSGDDRTLLAQHYIDGLSIDRLAMVLGIHRSSAARRIEHVRSKLLEATRERLAANLEMDAPLFESLMRLASGELQVSVFRLLRN